MASQSTGNEDTVPSKSPGNEGARGSRGQANSGAQPGNSTNQGSDPAAANDEPDLRDAKAQDGGGVASESRRSK
jgi:hypothetical protein